jgi:hypothetical protein
LSRPDKAVVVRTAAKTATVPALDASTLVQLRLDERLRNETFTPGLPGIVSGMTASLLVSVFALVLSALSFAVNLWVCRRATIRGRKPVLAFIDKPGASRTIRDIGNGPALNVLVAQRQSGQWFNPVRVRPLAKIKLSRWRGWRALTIWVLVLSTQTLRDEIHFNLGKRSRTYV